MLTCKEFMQELNDYLDEAVDVEVRRKIEVHIYGVSELFCDFGHHAQDHPGL